MSGIRGGISHGILAKRDLDKAELTPGSRDTTGGKLDQVASTGEYLSYLAGTDLNEFNKVLGG